MYGKNLKNDVRIRVSNRDFDFLKGLADDRGDSISEVVRSIIGEYRRSVETIKILNEALDAARGEDIDK